jgi:hypothetical protein
VQLRPPKVQHIDFLPLRHTRYGHRLQLRFFSILEKPHKTQQNWEIHVKRP